MLNINVDPTNWLKSNNGSGGGSKSASKWKSDIKRAAKATGTKLSGGKLNDIVRLIQTESNGNPKAVQGGYTDVNSGGNEARGLLQYTPGTWNGYKTKNGGNIMNGYHQLKAFFNNSNWSSDLASWKRRMARGQTGWGPTGSKRGYATGGIINSSGMYNLAEGGFPEIVIPTDPKRSGDAMKLMNYAATKIKGGNNKRPNQVSNKYASNNSGGDSTELLLQMIANQQAQMASQQKQLDALLDIARSNRGIEDKPVLAEKDISQAQGNRGRINRYTQGL